MYSSCDVNDAAGVFLMCFVSINVFALILSQIKLLCGRNPRWLYCCYPARKTNKSRGRFFGGPIPLMLIFRVCMSGCSLYEMSWGQARLVIYSIRFIYVFIDPRRTVLMHGEFRGNSSLFGYKNEWMIISNWAGLFFCGTVSGCLNQ